jgi:shikimate kinase
VSALSEHTGVLSLGGGAVLSEATRQRLKPHHVVFLSVGLGEGVKRVGLARDRPVLTLNPRAILRQLLEERLPYYLEVATQQVDTDGKTPEAVADEVLA